jgi:flagellar motor switch protein FliM
MGRPSKPSNRAQPYNDNRLDRVSKNQLRPLHFVHDRFSRNVSSAH